MSFATNSVAFAMYWEGLAEWTCKTGKPRPPTLATKGSPSCLGLAQKPIHQAELFITPCVPNIIHPIGWHWRVIWDRDSQQQYTCKCSHLSLGRL